MQMKQEARASLVWVLWQLALAFPASLRPVWLERVRDTRQRLPEHIMPVVVHVA
jgi:hypothetical protein